MIHLYMPTRTHQSRGEPFMVSAMSALKMLHAYREAEVIAARIGASKMGMLTTPTGDDFMGDGLENDFQPVIQIQVMQNLNRLCCAAYLQGLACLMRPFQTIYLQ